MFTSWKADEAELKQLLSNLYCETHNSLSLSAYTKPDTQEISQIEP